MAIMPELTDADIADSDLASDLDLALGSDFVNQMKSSDIFANGAKAKFEDRLKAVVKGLLGLDKSRRSGDTNELLDLLSQS